MFWIQKLILWIGFFNFVPHTIFISPSHQPLCFIFYYKPFYSLGPHACLSSLDRWNFSSCCICTSFLFWFSNCFNAYALITEYLCQESGDRNLIVYSKISIPYTSCSVKLVHPTMSFSISCYQLCWLTWGFDGTYTFVFPSKPFSFGRTFSGLFLLWQIFWFLFMLPSKTDFFPL